MLEVRTATLASIVAKARPGIRFNEHMEGDVPTVFANACKMGLEGMRGGGRLELEHGRASAISPSLVPRLQ